MGPWSHRRRERRTIRSPTARGGDLPGGKAGDTAGRPADADITAGKVGYEGGRRDPVTATIVDAAGNVSWWATPPRPVRRPT